MEKHYTLGLYEKALPRSLSWYEKLQTAADCHFDFVELSIDESDEKLSRLDYSPFQCRELHSAMLDTGLFFRSMCLSGHRKYPLGSTDKTVRERGMDIFKKAVDLASYLGIRIIQLAGYDVYYEAGNEQTRAFFLEYLHKAVHFAAGAGIVLGFETMETPFMDTVTKAMTYVEAVNSPYLGIYPDLGNLTNAALVYGTDVYADLERGRGHILAMHLKETMPGKYREIPFGTGHVNFTAGIAKAWQLGVRRYVTELWDTGTGEWETAIQHASAMMRGVLDNHR